MALYTVPRVTAQKAILMTDPTERLAEALQETPYSDCTCPLELIRTICTSCTAERFAAQGFGHRDDIVRAFARYWRSIRPYNGPPEKTCADYIASLAAKEEGR